MTKIVNFEEGVRQIIAQAIRRARAMAKDYALPIYGDNHGAPEHIGTCFLLQHRDVIYLVTAAHVIDEASITSLYVGVEGEFIPLLGDFFTTVAPDNIRDKDRYDFAWLKIDDKESTLISKCKFIPASAVSKNRVNPDSRVYLAIGYPNSKNKINRRALNIAPQRATYYSTFKPHEQLFKNLGISNQSHISIDYKSKVLDEDYNIVNAFYPKGISGGPFFDLGRLVSKDDLLRSVPLDPLLSGMIIEYHKDHKALLAVKIDLIIDHIESKNAV